MTDNITLAMLTAEAAYKCCEKGENWEATRAKISELIGGPTGAELSDLRALARTLEIARASTDTTRKIATLRRWSKKPLADWSCTNTAYLTDIADEFERCYRLMIHRHDEMPWRPIEELSVEDRYGDENGLLLLAPELIDLDCNVHGVGMGYWQDDRDAPYDEHGRIDGPEPDDSYRLRVVCRIDDNDPRYIDVMMLEGEALSVLGASLGVVRGEYGGWLACKWSMTNDEWSHVPCTPTHYLRLRGAET